MIAIAIVTGVLGVWQTLLSNQVGQRVMHDLRAAVFRHLQRLSLAFFTRTRTGEVQSRISNDIGGVQSVVTNTATSIVSNVTTVLATMIGMDRPQLGAVALRVRADPGVRAADAARRRTSGARSRRRRRRRSPTSRASCRSRCRSPGSCSARRWGAPTSSPTGSKASRSTLADLEVRQRMAGRWVMASIQTSFAVMPAAVYWFGGLALAHGSHAISVPTLVAFTTLQTRLFFPVGSLLGVGLDVQTSLALFDRIFEYLDQPVDIEERPGARALDQAGDVAFDHVWFRYGDGAWTLEDVTFTVPAGTTTALVGETGSGKTTLGYLAARLYDVNEGSVRIGGVDVRDLSFASLADLVGVVSQETYLFHATVRENLRFAKPDATDDEIELAAEAARIHDLIASLPEGYDTVVGERGYRFSGGEKQRIAIARTVLRNPPILVLDEATSSLDTETERQVQEALDRLAEGRTTIAIAHRLSTVRDADQIVVLDGGQGRRAGHTRRLGGVLNRWDARPGGRYAASWLDADRAPGRLGGGSVGGVRRCGHAHGRWRRVARIATAVNGRLSCLWESLPVAERPRRPEWMKVRAPSAERQLLRREEADPRREPEHDLRGGALPEHRRVLGPRHRDLPDPRRHLHPRLPLLLRALRQAERARRPARAAPARADREADGPEARRRHLGRSRRRARQGRRPLRGDDPRAQGEGAGRVDRGADAGLPRRRGGGAADGDRRAPRRLQPQHRDRPPPAPQDARRQGELRRRARAAAPREGDRRLPRADEERDHRRPRRDERRGRRDAARPARDTASTSSRSASTSSRARSTRRSTAGCIPTSSAGSASRARRSASARSSPARSCARAIAPTSSATRPRPAAAPSPTRTTKGRWRGRHC